MSSLKPLMEKLEDGHLPFICLQYNDSAGVNHLVPGVYLGNVDSMGSSKLRNMVTYSTSVLLYVHHFVYG